MADPISWAVIAYTSVKGAFVMAASSAAFAVGASAATSLTVGAAAASAFKFAAITAASIAANALFAPNVGASGSPTEWRSDPNAGLPFVAGRLGVAGNLIYSKEFGANNRYLGNVTLYSRAGPVHSMGPFYADGVNITFGAGGVATNGGNIANNMWLSSQDGLQPQSTALPLPGALSAETFTGWTANHKLSGCAADLQVLRQDSKFQTYPSGQPRRYRVIEGIKVYDPRLDGTYPGGEGACRLNDRATYVYTANPIIQALNWCIGYYENGKPVGGLADPAGPTLDGIDTDAFISAANIADANSWTGLGARYSTADDKHQVLLGFLQAGGALYAENAGRISCVSRGAVKTSVMTLTRADTAGPITVDAMPPRRVVINSLIPRCIQETYQWEPVDLEPVTVAALVTADGGVRRRNKDFPFVTSSVQASQLAALDILDAREPLSGSTTFKPYVRDLNPGDAFTWNEPGFFLNGVKCVVMGRSYDPASDTVEITWRSETDSKIAFALGLDPTPPVFPSVTPANPSFVPVPSTDDWDVDGGSIGDDGGPRGPVITIEADVTDLTDVTHILVDVRESGDTEWTHHGEFPLAGFSREQILGLLPNATYDVRLRYRNAFGVVDDAQETIFLNITTGAQVVQSALDAAPGSALADAIAAAQDAADAALAELDLAAALLDPQAENIAEAAVSIRSQIDDGRQRASRLTGEVLASLALITSGQAAAQDENLLRQVEIVQLDVRADGISATATQALAATVDLEANKAEVSRVVDLEALVGTDDGQGALIGRVGAVETATADLETGKVDASTFNLVEARVTAVEGEAAANEQAITDTVASVTALDAATAERDRAQARRLSRTLAEIAAGSAQATQGVSAVADGLRVEAKRVFDLSVRAGDAEARLGTAESALIDLENNKAEASRVTTLETQMGTDDGQGTVFSRVATAENAIVDLENNTATAQSVTDLTVRVTTVETDLDTAEQTLSETVAGLTTLEQATIEQGRAQARRLSRALAEVLAGSAQAVQGVSTLADGLRFEATRVFGLQVRAGNAEGRLDTAESALVDLENDKAEVTSVTNLSARVDDTEADITINAGAIASLEGAAAVYEVVVAASGSNPAIVQLRAGVGGSVVNIGGDRVVLFNLGALEDEIRPVLTAINGRAHFAEPIYTASGVGKHTIQGFFGPSGQEMWIWTGANTIFADTATRLNGDFALGVDGQIYFGTEGRKPWLRREPRVIYAQNDDTVTFNPPFDLQPEWDISTIGLAPLAAGEAYDLRLIDFTTDGAGLVNGATLVAEISEQSSFTSVSNTGAGGTGSTFDFQRAKADTADAFNGVYTFFINGSIQVVNNGEGAEGSITLDFGCFKSGTGYVPTTPIRRTLTPTQLGINWNAASGTHAFTAQPVNIEIPNALPTDTNVDFGVDTVSQQHGTATVTGLPEVTYTKATLGTPRTATPASTQAKITVRPQTIDAPT